MDEADNQELLHYRLGLFHDAIKMEKKPERVPHMSNFWAWMILDAGYKLSEAILDYKIVEKIVIEFQEKYNFDYLAYTGQRLNRLRNIFGASPHKLNDEKECVYYEDIPLVNSSEFEELGESYLKCMWERALPRKFENFNQDMPIDLFKQAGLELIAFRKCQDTIISRLMKEYGIPRKYSDKSAAPFITPSFETLFTSLRGIKALSIDMRREPDRLEAVINAMDEALVIPSITALAQAPKGRNKDLVFDCTTTLLGHTILNRKQIERFFWPTLKRLLDAVVAADKSIYMFVEGQSEPLWDYLASYPKGHIVLHIEQDDILKARKRLPNCCLAGGMPVDILGNGTKQECVDYAKRLVDEVGAEGGFILSQNKMVSSRIDCKAENIKAVSDFVCEYRS